MNYDWMSYEEIEKVEYPNLLAEIKESGYSICTISDRMGLGGCEENDPAIWDKLTGKTDIFASEMIGLARLFGVSAQYLFADKLSTFAEKSMAYWRWYEQNKQKEKELQVSRYLDEIDRLVRNSSDVEYAKAVYSFAKGYERR